MRSDHPSARWQDNTYDYPAAGRRILPMHDLKRLPPCPVGTHGQVHVVIDTPRGSRNKVKWDEEMGAFKLSHVLTAGAVFPFDFGFVPGTLAEDGDAIDVLVLVEE